MGEASPLASSIKLIGTKTRLLSSVVGADYIGGLPIAWRKFRSKSVRAPRYLAASRTSTFAEEVPWKA
jgi:hypothetical protein